MDSQYRQSPLLAFGCMILIVAASMVAHAEGYGFDVWTTANGLPQNTVTGLAQTPDGYLWLSTFDGLARFDGVRFTIFDKGNTKGIINNRFARLFADREGTFYAVTEDGVITMHRNGEFISYSQFAASGEPIAEIVGDAEGHAVFETENGYYALQGDHFVLLPEQKNANVIQAYFGSSGAKWVIKRDQITRQQGGQITSYQIKLTAPELERLGIPRPYEDRQGALWVTRQTPDAELWRFHEGKVTAFTKKEIPGLSELYPSQISEDDDGTISVLLAGHDATKINQLVRLIGDQSTTFQLKDPMGPIASLKDREGNFWLATSTGLRRLRRKIFTTLSVADGLNSNETYPLIQTSGGDIFIGTIKGVNRYADGKITNIGLTYSSNQPLYMRGFWEDARRRLWLGYQGEGGFGRFAEPASLMKVGKDELPSGATDFASDREGNIWIATDDGLFKFRDDQEVAHYTAADGLPSGRVVTLHVDRIGNLWIGTFDGLSQLKDGRFINYNTEPNCPQGLIRAIYEDADGVLWFGTYGDGLVRYKDSKFFNFRVEHGLFNNGVFAILEDKRANFWMSSNRGIHRVSKQELNDFADGKIPKLNSVSYDEKDGMLNAECNGGRLPAAIKASDGKFWFPTMGGVAIIDPEAETLNPNPPPVVIESISIDRKPVDHNALETEVQLQPGQSNIAIEYTGLSLIKSEQIKFRYKLEGLEPNWVEAGTKRTVDYSYLPAGTYTFRLIAANANGVWNNEGTAIKIVVHPFFYQTWWFIGFLALGLGLVIWWFYHTRVSRLRAIAGAKTQFSRQLIESQEAERKRIASELHDGLGQSLVIIKNRAMLGLNKGEDRERVAKELGSISESASQALEEVRDITNNLRPQLLDRLGLTKAIQAMLKKLAGVIEIDIGVDDIDDLFSENNEINIYRIVQESVNNIIKHSNASNASVRIDRGSSIVSIKIDDNGKGFDTSTVSIERRNLGLVGLRERSQLLRGEFMVESRIGEGTTIRVNIPFAKNT